MDHLPGARSRRRPTDRSTGPKRRLTRRSAGPLESTSSADRRSTHGARVINYLQWESAEHLALQRAAEFPAIAGRLAGLIDFDAHECKGHKRFGRNDTVNSSKDRLVRLI